MARIECYKCSEMIDVTASSVVLPYVCSICDDAAYLSDLELDDEECDCGTCTGDSECKDIPMEVLGTNQKYEDMAPAGNETHTLGYLGENGFQPTEALIADLKAQNESLLKEVEFCDRRVRQYQRIAKNEEALRVSAEARLANLQKQSAGYSTTLAAYKECEQDLQATRAQVDDLMDRIHDIHGARAHLTEAMGIIKRASCPRDC